MIKYKYCPKCSQPLEDDGKCAGCSYGHKAAQPKDEFGKQCAFNDTGYRCQKDGHLSGDTHGKGSWYCRAHFARVMGWQAWEAATPSKSRSVSPSVEEIARGLKEPWRTKALEHHGLPITDDSQAEVDARVNKIVPRLPGESDHAWSMRCKDWALARLKTMGTPQTQPEPGWNG